MASGATTEILTHPYRVFRYKVEIESITAGAFSEVSGLEATVDVVEYRTGNASRPTVQKLPGLTRYGNVRLSRGIIGELDTLAWLHSAAADGTSGPTGIQRRLVTITLLDDATTGRVGNWSMPGPFPIVCPTSTRLPARWRWKCWSLRMKGSPGWTRPIPPGPLIRASVRSSPIWPRRQADEAM